MHFDSKTALIAAAVLGALAPAASAQQWNLVFEDEFTGSSLSPTWQPMIGTGCEYGNCGWGNNELEYYTARPQNIAVSNGTLKIIARQENYGGSSYTSARLRTINQLEVKYGRIEARLKIPSTTGIWPAFWALPTNSPYGGWAASGEIDIMESINTANRTYGTIHFGGQWPENNSNGGSQATGVNYGDDFHTYAIEWDPNRIRWFVDGNVFHTVYNNQWYSTNGGTWAPFDNDFHLLLNVAVGGNWPGYPDGSSVFPQTMEVDWVRVYEAVQSPFGGTPQTIPGVVQCENYDVGGGGTAFMDADPANNGSSYRTDAVDIEATTGGGFNIGWVDPGEWLEYTVNVQNPGPYDVAFRVASQPGGGQFILENGDEPGDGALTPVINVAATGGWQSWTLLNESITLPAGEQVLRVRIPTGAGEFNFDSMTFTFTGVSCVADVTTTNTNPFDPNYGVPDGTVDGADLGYFIEKWLGGNALSDITTTNTNPGDPNYAQPDGLVDGADLSYFVEVWLSGCA